MTDDLVDTRTDTLWEPGVVQRAGIGISVDTSFVTDGIKLIGSDSRSDMSGCSVENLSR